jgi:hypothetical protein
MYGNCWRERDVKCWNRRSENEGVLNYPPVYLTMGGNEIPWFIHLQVIEFIRAYEKVRQQGTVSSIDGRFITGFWSSFHS